MKRIINCETSEVIERNLTEDELAEQSSYETEIKSAQAAAKAQAEAKSALLERLGITEEEAKLLLG